MQPEAIQRDTCVFLGGHGTAPLGGTEPSALGYRNSQLSAARRPPGSSWRSEGVGSCSGWAPSAPFTLELELRAAVTPQQGLPPPPAQNVKMPPACMLTPKTVILLPQGRFLRHSVCIW